MEIIVKEKSISDQMREFWELENLGINVDSENKDSTAEEIMRKFEEGISYKDKRYKVKLPWKPEMKNALHNNKEVAPAEDSKLSENPLSMIQFRIYSVVVTADIKQAFLQIEIHEEDRNYTRFLWTADPENSNSGLDWDEIVPDEIVKIFNDWCDDLKKLSNIRITRHYFSGALPKDIHNIELHLFSDASIKAYGTVVYLRVELNDGNVITSFVASKGRVAPLKKLSLPRLELMEALLSARLSEKIMKGLEFPVQRIFWTDSSIVFFWIKGSPDKFKVFIKNRIQEIHKLSNPSEWFHCPGKENPGDLISRGLSVAELENSDFWWQGPSWLREKKLSWPKPLKTHKELVTDPETLEIRKTLAVNTVMEDTNQSINNFIKKYSSFTKLIRITAYCLRFLKNCRITQSGRKKDNLNASELQNATHVLIKCAQLSEWSLIQRLRDTFWARWSSEYLNELQRRTKWTDVKENLKVGQLVLLKNASQIPMKWTLARVIKIDPGEDGLVRVVDVKTAKGTFTRAVTNLLPLPGDVGLSPNGGRDLGSTFRKQAEVHVRMIGRDSRRGKNSLASLDPNSDESELLITNQAKPLVISDLLHCSRREDSSCRICTKYLPIY
ncbi:integrase catalytic domain-containing protein [Trichonephila inaurata madagascariensis]|uniref:Integrase catalytic domain-containing protein n=1 Tax=Trichonephila inaurata madagascariensis TaxID=2747483 RepID=A0A8X7C0U2_9ARAC|nr:integrase catalytic domain-containing protein [Trichonephila inaurata madagascariensis]